MWRCKLNAADIAVYVKQVQVAGDTILNSVEAITPGEDVTAESAEALLNLVAEMAQIALAAWSAAAGVPITVESVMALMPNPTPLTPPDPE